MKTLIGAILGTLAALVIFPGIDAAAFYYLHPHTFLQKAVVIGGMALTAWPLFIAAVFVWTLLIALVVELT